MGSASPDEAKVSPRRRLRSSSRYEARSLRRLRCPRDAGAAVRARRARPPRRAEYLATAPGLAALALAGPLELAAHLAVLGDVLGLVGGCVEVGLALGSAEP